nr:MAG TPA: hypothetical protein [Caudoviricetes sp.]
MECSSVVDRTVNVRSQVRFLPFRLPCQWSNWLNPFTCGGRSINTTRRMLCRNLLTL